MTCLVQSVEVFWHSRFIHRGLDELGRILKSCKQLAPTGIMHLFTALAPSSPKISVVSPWQLVRRTAVHTMLSWRICAFYSVHSFASVIRLVRLFLPEARGIEGDLGCQLGFGFDLPLLLLPSSPIQSRNCTHSGVPLHVRHSTNRTSWFCNSICAHRALRADLPWTRCEGDASPTVKGSVVVPAIPTMSVIIAINPTIRSPTLVIVEPWIPSWLVPTNTTIPFLFPDIPFLSFMATQPVYVIHSITLFL